MKELRHSRQRDAILEYLRSTIEHPTAETIYEHIRGEIPAISLGTVYRNLGLLEELGQVRRITPGANSPDRFDADMSAHQHLVCTRCHSVSDLHIDDRGLDEIARETSGGSIDGHSLVFYGTCSACMERQ